MRLRRMTVLALTMSCVPIVGELNCWAAGTSQRRAGATTSPAKENRYELTEGNGPWMVFVASFAGEGAEDEALALVRELRKRRIAAYLHAQNYDFTDTVQGLGLDRYGNPRKMRYQNSNSYREYAVLIGDYPSVDDARLQDTLTRVKYFHPDCLKKKDAERTTLRFHGLRSLQKQINGNPEKNKKGPLGHAFATPNPLLPKEAFSAPGMDTLVMKLNSGLPHSLLDCQGQYSVRIATFRGKVVIDQKEIQEIEENKDQLDSRLDQAANKADRLVKVLRRRGVDAYQFHDRYASYVTVGSFNTLGKPLPSGATELDPAIYRIMQTYGPQQKPVASKSGQPEYAVVPQSIQGIYLDVQPYPMEVPRHTIAADYSNSLVR